MRSLRASSCIAAKRQLPTDIEITFGRDVLATPCRGASRCGHRRSDSPRAGISRRWRPGGSDGRDRRAARSAYRERRRLHPYLGRTSHCRATPSGRSGRPFLPFLAPRRRRRPNRRSDPRARRAATQRLPPAPRGAYSPRAISEKVTIRAVGFKLAQTHPPKPHRSASPVAPPLAPRPRRMLSPPAAGCRPRAPSAPAPPAHAARSR
jgi:hypothetical protein